MAHTMYVDAGRGALIVTANIPVMRLQAWTAFGPGVSLRCLTDRVAVSDSLVTR